MRRRSPARWLAPLALIVWALAVAGVLGGALRPEDASAPPAQRSVAGPPEATAVSERRETTRRTSRPRRYTVRAGDTLTAISLRTGVSLQRLQQLNPELDSQSLQTGQRIKLSP
jgi:hypothetical protein